MATSPVKHTPAPWVYVVGTREIVRCEESGTLEIAKIVDESREDHANGMLMAAAPELLRSLKRWATFAKDNGLTDEDYHTASGLGWVSEMEAAIAKAEGR